MRALPPPRWHLPDARSLPDGIDYAGPGMDWDDATLLNAYAAGYFPMPRELESDEIDWWSPDPRGVLPLDGLQVSRSLRKSVARFDASIDDCFEQVVRHCGNPGREHGWINDDIVEAYVRLHEMGWAHSVETWLDGRLVGGLYGVRIGRFFAGESMFSTVTDASKVALVHLVDWLRDTEIGRAHV